MTNIIVDAGPFIHLTQIAAKNLLKKFSSLYAPNSIVSEISLCENIAIEKVRKWKNLKIIHNIKENGISKIEEAIKDFRLHRGESDVLYLAAKLTPSIVLTDDLAARNACKNLGIEVHGTVGIIAYSYHKKWISFIQAEKYLRALDKSSSLFITSAIIENAIKNLSKN